MSRVACESEPLSGEWQQAESHGNEPPNSNTYDGELVSDMAAVSDYLAAAGEQPTISVGQILSVYA